MYSYTCPTCGRSFEDKRLGRRYCSRKCSNQFGATTLEPLPLVKQCSRCEQELLLETFSPQPRGRYGKHSRCKPCNAEVWRERYASDEGFRDRHKQRWATQRMEKWGLSPDDFAGAQCAICGSPRSVKRRLHIDHDHRTGDFRGLLCGPCNVALGMFRDNPSLLATAATYVLKTGGDALSR